MTKRRLSQRQHRLAKTQQHKRLNKALTGEAIADDTLHGSLGPEQIGTVVANFGQNTIVQDERRHPYRCVFRQNLGAVVCGDRVVWQSLGANDGVISALLPRTTILERPSPRGDTKPVAANIDQVLVLTAPVPALQRLLVDRYLVASEISGLKAVVVVNKIDLLSSNARLELEREMQTYQTLGYTVLFVSAKYGEGVKGLLELVQNKTSILAGQSGVGKSSTIKFLLPDQEIQIGELTERFNLGKHTTTTSRLFNLPGGGTIIDSPGVRDLGLWQYSKEQLLKGFVEFREVIGHCKFRSCTHRHEPGCAIREGVELGQFDKQRYASLLRILE